jgi:antitoxin Phd
MGKVVPSMKIDSNSMVSITEASQNFSKVAKLVDQLGAAVIMKNDMPKYLVLDFSQADTDVAAADEEVERISNQLLEKNRVAYEVLAK